jgi:hypothetical protein
MNGFHESFAQALLTPPGADPGLLAALVEQPAFAVYRNTVAKGCADALAANFPTVLRVVGEDWFRDVAVDYARRHPPRDVRLLAYGDEGFGAFLQAVPTAAALPWLEGVARLDTLWRAAHVAADAPVLPAGALAALDAQALAACRLLPHPATRWAWFDQQPVPGIWMREREHGPAQDDLAWRGEGLLLVRPEGEVAWQPLPQAGCVLLDACAAGLPLGVAAEQALARDPHADLAQALQQLLRSGAFTSLAKDES